MRQENQAKREIKSEQDRLAFGKPTAELEWDGIRKLDMPPPRWWVLTFWACFIFAVVWWVLYPSWPGARTYFPGLLGYDQRAVVAEQIAAADERRATAAAAIDRLEQLEQVKADPDLLQYAVTAGGVAFANNCAPCHGLGGAGQGFFPSLADDDWIWGGTLGRHPADHHPRHPQWQRGGARFADAAVRRRSDPDPRPDPRCERVCAVADRAPATPRPLPRARPCSPRTASPAMARAASACRSSARRR